jgi:hypothetical protein
VKCYKCPDCKSGLYLIVDSTTMQLECRAHVNDGMEIDAYGSRPINSRPCGWKSTKVTMNEHQHKSIYEACMIFGYEC